MVPDPREFRAFSIDFVSWNRFHSLKAGVKIAENREIGGSGARFALLGHFLGLRPVPGRLRWGAARLFAPGRSGLASRAAMWLWRALVGYGNLGYGRADMERVFWGA